MTYNESYIQLQLDFARIISKKLNIPLLEALYSYTNIYLLLTLDFSFNQNNETWKDFELSFEDNVGYMYGKYLKAQNSPQNKDVKRSKSYGCFSYHIENDKETAKIHFSNNDNTDLGPLAKENLAKRKEELQKMFIDIKEINPEIKFVRGKSWLYSVEAYKRLFPKEYTESVSEFDGSEWQFMTRWGQFLDSRGKVKENLASDFLECIRSKETTDEMLACFPLRVYMALCDVKYFYSFTQNTF